MPCVCDRGELPISANDRAATHEHQPAVDVVGVEPPRSILQSAGTRQRSMVWWRGVLATAVREHFEHRVLVEGRRTMVFK